jgi:hypothetical protein
MSITPTCRVEARILKNYAGKPCQFDLTGSQSNKKDGHICANHQIIIIDYHPFTDEDKGGAFRGHCGAHTDSMKHIVNHDQFVKAMKIRHVRIEDLNLDPEKRF